MKTEDDAPLGPFPAGVNNVKAEDATPADALRAARNVDLDNEGWPARRAGRTQRVAATRMHSLFVSPPLTPGGESPYLYANKDGDLVAYTPDLSLAATIRAGIGARFVSYAQVTDDLYWTNGLQLRRVDADLGDHPGALATPTPPTVAPASSGGLAAGEYWLALTWLDLTGRESGASPPVAVTVPDNGGILITGMPAAAEDAVTVRVYVSTPNSADPVLYLALTRPAGTTTALLGAHRPGPKCDTLFHAPLPAGQIVRFAHGRLLVASRNMLCWSPGLRAGLMNETHALRFGLDIPMLEPVGEGNDGAGVFLSDHQRVYWLTGNGPDAWNKQIRYMHPAVPGTSLTAPGDAFGLETNAPVAFWLSTNGVFCLGLPGGVVQPITQGRLALDPGERGASVFREFDGIRQIFTSFLVGGGNAFGVSDSAVGTIRRNGVSID